jgi:hypothetical protein
MGFLEKCSNGRLCNALGAINHMNAGCGCPVQAVAKAFRFDVRLKLMLLYTRQPWFHIDRLQHCVTTRQPVEKNTTLDPEEVVAKPVDCPFLRQKRSSREVSFDPEQTFGT